MIPTLSYQECGKSEDPRSFLRLPERPSWTRDMKREELESLEEREFAEWLEEMHRETKREENVLEEPRPFEESNPDEINWFGTAILMNRHFVSRYSDHRLTISFYFFYFSRYNRAQH